MKNRECSGDVMVMTLLFLLVYTEEILEKGGYSRRWLCLMCSWLPVLAIVLFPCLNRRRRKGSPCHSRQVMVFRWHDFATRPITRRLCLAPWPPDRRPLNCSWRVHSFRAAASGGGGGGVGGPGCGQTQKLLSEYVAGSSVCIIIESRFKDRAMSLTLLGRGSKMVVNMSLPDFYPSSRLAWFASSGCSTYIVNLASIVTYVICVRTSNSLPVHPWSSSE
jgi:hypothetical protein